MKSLLPVVFVLIAAAIFFGYIDPAYSRVQELQAEEEQFEQALTRSRELQQVRDQLLSRYNVIPQADIERLEKLLPDNVDNVRLVLDMDSIAARYGMRTRNVQLEIADDRPARGQIGEDDREYQSVIVSFSVAGSYDSFRSFIEDLERSLRLVDIVGINFNANNQTDTYDYSVSIKTYWLKP